MRYWDELPHAARTAFRIVVARTRDGDLTARGIFYAIGVLDADRTHMADLFDRVALVIHQLPKEAGASARRLLFGLRDEARLTSLFEDMFEEIEFAAKGREERITQRIADGTHSQDDVDWIRARAESLSDELLLEMNPFSGDESEAKELSRKVVRGRVPHTCHWTKRTIQPGERHLVIREVVEGEFLTTRHSVLAAYLDVVGQDPGLAGHLAPRPVNEEAA